MKRLDVGGGASKEEKVIYFMEGRRMSRLRERKRPICVDDINLFSTFT